MGGQAKHVIAVVRMTTNTICGAGPEKGHLQVGGAAVVMLVTCIARIWHLKGSFAEYGGKFLRLLQDHYINNPYFVSQE